MESLLNKQAAIVNFTRETIFDQCPDLILPALYYVTGKEIIFNESSQVREREREREHSFLFLFLHFIVVEYAGSLSFCVLSGLFE